MTQLNQKSKPDLKETVFISEHCKLLTLVTCSSFNGMISRVLSLWTTPKSCSLLIKIPNEYPNSYQDTKWISKLLPRYKWISKLLSRYKWISKLSLIQFDWIYICIFLTSWQYLMRVYRNLGIVERQQYVDLFYQS